MTTTNYTEFRDHLLRYMEAVCDDAAPLTITRQRGRSVVLLSAAEFEGMLETLHLLKSPANAADLLAGIAEANAGNLIERDLVE